jgi:hypothetical protein
VAPQDDSAKKAEAPTYHVDRLIPESWDRFGVESHVAAGAFSTLSKKNLTVDEGKAAIDKWLKRPVETDNVAEEA